MPKHHRRTAGDRHHGVTLLELLLVMALLVTVAAMATPSIGRTLDSQRLRSAAEQVRVQWTKARLEAMESGRTYSFRYEPAGSKFVVEPWVSLDDYLESSQITLNGAPVASASPPAAEGSREESNLPESVTFLTSDTLTSSRDYLQSQSTGASMATAGNWSSPMFFYPDGTTSTARLQLGSSRGWAMEVSIRGLTGMVTVREIPFPEGEAL